jgi:hypothetical protein
MRSVAPAAARVNGLFWRAAMQGAIDAPMRRSTTVRVIGAVLVIGVGAYSIFWWIAAGRIKREAEAWALTAPQYGVEASWKTMRVAGYPFAFRLELGEVAARTAASGTPGELHAPLISASIALSDLHAADFNAPGGLEVGLGPAEAPIGKLSAAKASGAFAIGSDGQRTVWLSLFGVKATAGQELGARVVYAWVIAPAHPPASHTEPAVAVAMLLRDLAVPAAPPGFKNTIDEIGAGATLMGAWPPGSPRQAATAWRDAGGTVELDHLTLRWGGVGVNGNGTLALDGDLQPVGALSGGVTGYDPLLKALVAAGRIKPNDAQMARLGLALLAHPGPDGRAEIATALAIQNGEMRLGPAKLGPAPRINW